MGRVKIRFHWQQAEAQDDRDSRWVVASSTGKPVLGMGGNGLCIGQEVPIDFPAGTSTARCCSVPSTTARGGRRYRHSGAKARRKTVIRSSSAAEFTAPVSQGNTTGGNSPAWRSATDSHQHAGFGRAHTGRYSPSNAILPG